MRLAHWILFALAFGTTVSAAPQRPNIVVILADDLGFSDLSCYGSEIHTPALDQLAARGLRFTQFYNAGRCCPSRASLLTGLYPHQAGVGAMIDDYAKGVRDRLNSPAYDDHLSTSAVTIAEVLRAGGYRTMMCGKWHLGYRPEEWPVRRGFDHSLVQIDGAMNFFGVGVQHKGEDTPPMAADDRPFVPPQDGFFSTDAYTDKAIEWVRAAGKENKPFFVYLAYNAPHWPLHAPAEDVAKYRGKYKDGWEATRRARHRRQQELGIVARGSMMAPPDRGAQKPWDQLTENQRDQWDLRMAVYAAQVERMDRGIGRLVEALRGAGVEDNTLVLFLSDNGGAAEDPNKGKPGAEIGTRDSYRGYARPWATVSNTPWRLHKQKVHEGGISSPAIACWPGRVAKPGSITQVMAHLVDVMATCVDVSGASYPTEVAGRAVPPMEGTPLAAVFGGGELSARVLCWEHEGNRAVRDGDWKLVSVAGGPWELYDLSTDRVESKDLAAHRPERVRELDEAYQSWAGRCGVLPYPVATRGG